MGLQDLERLQQKIAKDPDSKLFVPLAEEYRKAGLVDDAINLLVQGLEKHPNYLSAHVLLGKIFMEKRMLAEAKNEFQKVIAIIPDNLYAHKKLADIYRELGDRKDTVSELRIILNLNPADEWALATLSAIEKELPENSEEHLEQEKTGFPTVSAVMSGDVQKDLEAPLASAATAEDATVELPVEDESFMAQAGKEEPSPLHKAVLAAESDIRQGNYIIALNTYKTLLSEYPADKEILQRMAELKTLLKITGMYREVQIAQLEKFLDGIKKRSELFGGS